MKVKSLGAFRMLVLFKFSTEKVASWKRQLQSWQALILETMGRPCFWLVGDWSVVSCVGSHDSSSLRHVLTRHVHLTDLSQAVTEEMRGKSKGGTGSMWKKGERKTEVRGAHVLHTKPHLLLCNNRLFTFEFYECMQNKALYFHVSLVLNAWQVTGFLCAVLQRWGGGTESWRHLSSWVRVRAAGAVPALFCLIRLEARSLFTKTSVTHTYILMQTCATHISAGIYT